MHHKNFDIEQDFQYYIYDFQKLGIDLMHDRLSWFKFINFLNGILLDETSNISKIISFRTYEKPSKNGKLEAEKRHKYMMSMKQKYALKNATNTNDGFGKLWNYLEKKVGENKVQKT